MFYNELSRTWDRLVARDGLFLAAEFLRLLGNTQHNKAAFETLVHTTYPGKRLVVIFLQFVWLRIMLLSGRVATR